jgi:hypothetical protein
MAKPVKRKVATGRTTSTGRATPKGGAAGAAAKAAASNKATTTTGKGASTTKAKAGSTGSAPTRPAASSRYTPKSLPEYRVSPTWVPVLMFAFLIVGALVIIVNYTGAAWNTNNWYLIGGLSSILAGILVATQWH